MPVELLPLLGVENPYPGLRPFEAHEAFLFQGRQDHTRALLERLSTDRFLAVVGGSGSGKSSLVRAGLLPALYRGYLVGASSRWRIAVMRPGSAPLDELARALAAPEALGVAPEPLRRTIGRTSLGLVAALQKAQLGSDENVLLVVDQFEELFRFERERRHQDGGAEACLFVQSLIEAADSYGARLFVVITMRSDYLGQCAQFAGLPEALNRGQYLIPHLTREQRREAIEKPPLVANARIKPALAQQLLNDMGEDPGQLPVLQHALMRTFGRLRESRTSELDFEHYAGAGGLAHALDQHADSIVASLPPGPRAWVERLFRALTTMEGGRAVRRPARLDRIFEVLGVTTDEAARADVRAAIEAFADPENSLLVSSTGLPLREGSVIDISHESLIRNWRQLQQWLREETRSAEWFLSLAGDTLRFRAGDVSPWRDPELARVIQLKNDARWNDAWARQYLPQADPPYAEILRFLDESVRTQQQERAEREAQRRREIDDARALAAHAARAKKFYRLFMWTFVALLAAASIAAVIAWREHEANAAEAEATLAMAARLDKAAAEQEALMQQLRGLEAQLQKSQAGGKEDAGLRSRIAELENRLSTSKVVSNNARQQLQQNVVNSSGTEYSAALKQVADLQSQLKRARDERDGLQSRLDAFATVQTRDAAYWKTRSEAAEADARQLRAVLGPALLDPVILTLPRYSSVRLDGPPFSGRAHLVFADPGRSKSPASNLFVVLPKSKDGPAEFLANEKAAGQAAYRWVANARCPGYLDEADKSVWCFDVDRDKTLNHARQLGRFTFGPTTFDVVVAGWGQDVRAGGVDGITLVIHPSRSAPAMAK
jgi:hypothetical protein